jgi:hypothetical protein
MEEHLFFLPLCIFEIHLNPIFFVFNLNVTVSYEEWVYDSYMTVQGTKI